MTEKYLYPLDYFDIQVAFAWKWYLLAPFKQNTDFQKIIERKTALKKAFTHNKEQEGDESWNKTIQKASREEHSWRLFSNALYNSYLNLQTHNKQSASNIEVGNGICVQVKYNPSYQALQTHYVPTLINGQSALNRENRAIRFAQYQQVFVELGQIYSNQAYVVGNSWLYNIESYNWLFPRNKDKSVREERKRNNQVIGLRIFPPEDSRHNSIFGSPKLGSWATWGQFLYQGFQVRHEYAQLFLQKIEEANNIETLFDSFPLPVLYYSATIGDWLATLFKKDF